MSDAAARRSRRAAESGVAATFVAVEFTVEVRANRNKMPGLVRLRLREHFADSGV
jgi:hypothetical protein